MGATVAVLIIGMFTRAQFPSDEAIWKECFLHNDYRLETFTELDRVIDIGAHIGCFSLACLVNGAKELHCYEADPENYDQLALNMASFSSRVKVTHAAVWRSDIQQETISLFRGNNPDGSRNTGGATVIQGGEEIMVPVIKLDAIINQIVYAHLLKLDCEGAEYPILFSSKQLHKVGAIVVETHNQIPFSAESIVRGRRNDVHELSRFLFSSEGGSFREIIISRNMHCPLHTVWAIR